MLTQLSWLNVITAMLKKDDVYDKHDDNIIDTKWMIINRSQMIQYDPYMDYLLPS